MDRMDLEKAFAQPEPIVWPDGTEQPVRWITWNEQVLIKRLADADNEAAMLEIMPKVMPALLPGRSWEDIAATLDAQTMRDIVVYASSRYEQASQELTTSLGNGVAGTAPASPPPTPSATSLPASPAPTAVPCGVS